MDSLIGLILTPLLLIGVVLYVAWPLLKESLPQEVDEAKRTDVQKLLLEKDELLSNLKDIEMDFQMGKLSPEDYSELKTDFERRTVEVFKRLEDLKPPAAAKTAAE